MLRIFSISISQWVSLNWQPHAFLNMRTPRIAFLLLIGLLFSFLGGCSNQTEPLVIYSGKGLKLAMEDVKQAFEKQENTPVEIIYAGSDTLLKTLKKTKRGDLYIPGSKSYIDQAGKLVFSHSFVAHHVPIFAVHTDNPKKLRRYEDLMAPGVRIAVANKDMAAIGRVAEAIIKEAGPQENFKANIVVTGSTVNELLHMVTSGKVDATLVWTDMLVWESAKELTPIPLPDHLNKSKEIHVGVLSTSLSPEHANRFAKFMVSDGRAIFSRHGFGNY